MLREYIVKLAFLVQLHTKWYAPFQNPRLPRLACISATFIKSEPCYKPYKLRSAAFTVGKYNLDNQQGLSRLYLPTSLA